MKQRVKAALPAAVAAMGMTIGSLPLGGCHSRASDPVPESLDYPQVRRIDHVDEQCLLLIFTRDLFQQYHFVAVATFQARHPVTQCQLTADANTIEIIQIRTPLQGVGIHVPFPDTNARHRGCQAHSLIGTGKLTVNTGTTAVLLPQQADNRQQQCSQYQTCQYQPEERKIDMK